MPLIEKKLTFRCKLKGQINLNGKKSDLKILEWNLFLAARETTTLGGGQKNYLWNWWEEASKVEFRATFSKRENVFILVKKITIFHLRVQLKNPYIFKLQVSIQHSEDVRKEQFHFIYFSTFFNQNRKPVQDHCLLFIDKISHPSLTAHCLFSPFLTFLANLKKSGSQALLN